MPKFDDISLSGDLSGGRLLLGTDAGEGLVYDSTINTRRLRIHAYETRVLTTLTTGFPNVAGKPLRHTMTAAVDPLGFHGFVKLPRGTVLGTVFVLHAEPGTEANRDVLSFSRLNSGGNVVVASGNITHSNAAIARGHLVVNFTDTQADADPVAAGDFTWYEVLYTKVWDQVAAGAQTHDFYGFVITYHYPLNVTVKEPT